MSGHPIIAADGLEALAQQFGFAPEALPREAQTALHAVLEALAEAESLANLDPLTGALNRRAYLREVSRAISFLDRYGRQGAVIFFDLDGFKSINDGFGHAAGDAVLRHVARLLCDHVRESDQVGRIGGDEFGVILAETGAGDAHAKADALARLLAETPCLFEGRSHCITASVGVHLLGPQDDAERALALADQAMYAAKAAFHARASAA